MLYVVCAGGQPIAGVTVCYRAANEKLGNKIREQSKAIMQLTAEKQWVHKHTGRHSQHLQLNQPLFRFYSELSAHAEENGIWLFIKVLEDRH